MALDKKALHGGVLCQRLAIKDLSLKDSNLQNG